jgi:hypothetical protein
MQSSSITIPASSDAPPTCTTHYQALLEEYSRLLQKLREAPATPSALTDTYISPQPFSPMDLDAKNPATARKAGLKPRPDGQFSLATMALYYGMKPWNRMDTTEHRAALHALEEKRARHSLQLESGIDIDELACAPDESERKPLANRPRSTSLDTLLARLTESKIHEAVRKFLPAAETSLIGYLVKSLPSQTTVANVRATPTVFLEKLLQSSDADRLAQALLEKLDWYGGKPGEDASPIARNKLLSRAIRLWERRDTAVTRDIAGYQWHKRSNYGKSYQAIWNEFESHLLQSRRASSDIEAILLAALYRFEFPTDFHRSDTPEDLPYKSSLVWVNFVHGLNLVEAIEPHRVSHMTFQQLVDFPLQELKTATAQEQELIAWCRIPPTMDWAIANGIVLEDIHATYSPATQQRAIEALDQYTSRLTAAIARMDIDPPKRPDIADREIRTVFGHQVFTTDGRKLVRYYGPDSGSRQVPDLKQKRESLRDVYLWKRHANKNWLITRPDGETPTTATFSLNADGTLHTTATWISQIIRNRKLPDANQLFEAEYLTWLKATKSAYQTLLTHLFSCLPHDDLQAIEYGETKIHTLRKATQNLEADQETSALTMPLRLRMGLILRLSNNGKTSWYECLPRAGILRKRTDITDGMLNGQITTEQWSIRGTVRVKVRRGQSLPFDWDAHAKGHVPKNGATCTAIIEQLGDTYRPEPPSVFPPYISTNRAAEIATYIAKSFFYFDEDVLYESARKQTDLERLEEKRHTLLDKFVNFVPFFGNLDDLESDNPNKRINAIFGLYTDSLTFALPLGKFVSGTAKLVSTSVRMGYRHTLPQFSPLLSKLMVSSLQNFNPLDGMPSLARSLVLGLYAVNRLALKTAIKLIKRLSERTGTYDFIKGLPQVSAPGHFQLPGASDELAYTRNVADVPVRKVSNARPFDYRLIDPLSNKPYGPPLADKTYRLSPGRSSYEALEATDQQVTVRIAENAQIRAVPEIDGRTTLFIDDVPYRLDGNRLRRIELIDESKNFKRASCRIKRAPAKGVCINEFVTDAHGDPINTPALHSFDETKGYALWFGERRCTPLARPGHEGEFFLRDGVLYRSLADDVKPWTNKMTRLDFPKAWPQPKAEILADVQFQKGIYARIEIQGTYTGSHELHRVGAIVVPSIGDDTLYLFTRVNGDKYYLARLPAGQKLSELQTVTMKRLLKADLEEGTLGEELLRIHEGSLTANNVAAFYGISAVENAIESMERIAIRVGVPHSPPDNMKFVKVDTSPGEALLFDNSTRMMVTELPDGANTWRRSRDASPTLRRRTADIFDTLFQETTIDQKIGSVFRIDRTMTKLQSLLPRSLRPRHPRNIAYAEVTKTDGAREVYVSVSGEPDTTSKLPLFKAWPGAEDIRIGDTTYFNVDSNALNTKTSLLMDSHDNLLAIPKTYPKLPEQPTSLDSESKLIRALHRKYPDKTAIRSVNIATTMSPCESCAVIMKLFGHTGGENALNVIWK